MVKLVEKRPYSFLLYFSVPLVESHLLNHLAAFWSRTSEYVDDYITCCFQWVEAYFRYYSFFFSPGTALRELTPSWCTFSRLEHGCHQTMWREPGNSKCQMHCKHFENYALEVRPENCSKLVVSVVEKLSPTWPKQGVSRDTCSDIQPFLLCCYYGQESLFDVKALHNGNQRQNFPFKRTTSLTRLVVTRISPV